VIFDVDEQQFEARVIERSREVPVIVDFWAEWCGPCRTLGPALEDAVGKHGDDVDLAKLDVDANQQLAAAFGIRGIPAVKAFRDGHVVDEFTGAIPRPKVEQFVESLVPSEADRLAGAEDEESLRRALDADPTHAEAARKLGRLLLRQGEADEATAILERVAGDFEADGLAARARLVAADGATSAEAELAQAFDAWDTGDHEAALNRLQELVEAETDPERQDLLRQVMVAIFTELGPGDPLASEHRRRLAAALS
jgi:putative thioredoxin